MNNEQPNIFARSQTAATPNLANRVVSIDSDVLESMIESEQRLRAALRAGNVGTWEWDILTRTLSWSEVSERLHGLKPGQFRGTVEHFEQLMHPDDRQSCIAAIRETIARGGDGKHEYRVIMPDGRARWLQGLGKVVLDSAGVSIRFVGTVTDVTDRKDREYAEQELRQAHRKLASHIENTPLAVIEWFPDYRVKYWSSGAQHLFGWTEDEVRGKRSSDWKFVYEEDAERVREMTLNVFMKDQENKVVTNRNYTKSGAVVDCEWYNSALLDEDGQPTSLLSLVLDVTDRKRLELQFLQAQKMEVLGRLAGGIAHDYNNLLAVILGYAELLEEGLENDTELLPNVQNIQAAANRAAALTRQLLSFARRQVTVPRVLAPSDLIERSTKMLTPLLGADIEPILLLREDVGNVRIDPTQLEQVVMNLSINARDAMPDGGKLIIKAENCTLETPLRQESTEVPPGDYVLLSVTDTGTGMTPEVRQKVFEPFFSTKKSGLGTGLGLATCYGIVKQVGGDIVIDSEPGKGTTFQVYLPLARESVAVNESAESHFKILGGTETVLLVEDEQLVRDLSANALRRHGYTVFEAEHGVQALQILEERSSEIDLLVTDAIMPLMGGKELLEKVRTGYPNIKMILASGYSEAVFSSQNSIPSDIGFVQKPFSTRILLATVRTALDATCKTNSNQGST